MTNSKTTKRALLTSALAILACVAMLMGATFAWFTDAASTGVNKIVSGNLDVELWYKNKDTGEEFAQANKETPIFNNEALWEPGYVEYAVLDVRNVGSLALKYKLGINIAAETGSTNMAGTEFKLSDYIRFAVLSGDQSELGRDALVEAATAVDNRKLNEGYTVEEHLLPIGTDSAKKTVTLVLWVPTSVGNEANHKTGVIAPSIELGVNVVATQDTVEHDSFGNDYDQAAEYPVIDLAELTDALKNGGIVNVPEDLPYGEVGDTLEDRVVIDQPTTLNLDGKLISPDNMGNNNNNFVALMVRADTTINATANGGIDTGVNGGYGINVLGGATLVINGGEYYGGGTAVQVQKGTLIINGGHFAVEPFGEPWGYNFVLNCVDSAYKDGTAKIIIKGGTFVNFDPSNNPAEGAGTNFVADGYHVESETHGSDIWYTVVAD